MPSEKKTSDLISELTKLTSKGQIDWTSSDPPDVLTHGSNDVYPLYFQTTYRDQKIAVAQRRYQSYDGDRDRFYWNEEINLFFLDYRDKIAWQTDSPYTALNILFETVREQAADVDGIFDRLLEENDEL